MIIDSDTHIVESKDLWTSRMSKKWGDRVPHVRYIPEEDKEYWFIGDECIFGVAFGVIYSDENGDVERREDVFPQLPPRFDDLHPSCYDPHERTKVMDAWGIESAVLYPNLGFAGPDIYNTIPGASLEFQLEIARAYNDWVLDWALQEPGRFLPLAVIPYWHVPSAVQEVERCAALGHRGFVTTGAPQLHGQPILSDRAWDPMWAAVQAVGKPISFHSGGAGMERFYNESRLKLEGMAAMGVRTTTQSFLDVGIVATDLLMSGVLPRFPELEFNLVESGLGWIPFVLETLDSHFQKYDVRRQRPEFRELPSFYFRRQVYTSYWYERLEDWHLDAIPAEHILFETDYPHPTCLVGAEIKEGIEKGLGHQTADVREKVLHLNAARCFGVTERGEQS